MASAAPAPTDIPSPIAPNGTAAGNDTALPPLPGMPISARAAQLSQIYIGVTSILLTLCIVAFCVRIYQRVMPVWKVGLDDYFIVAGFAFTVTDWGMLLPMMVPTPGVISFERSTLAGKHSWLAIGIWGLSMTCIKLSIALTLLRIQGKERGWRIFLFSIMGVQVVYGVGNTLFNLVIACRPLEAAWNPTVLNAQCVSYEAMRAVSNLGSSINITTDVLLSLAPATFLRKLNRPLRERIFVCVLMGMGIFASASSIVKTVIIKDWGDPAAAADWWAMGVSICTWTALEQLLGVLAACVPAMKGLLQRCLGSVGVSLTDSRSHHRSAYYARSRAGTGGLGTRAVVGSDAAAAVMSRSSGPFHRGPAADHDELVAGAAAPDRRRYSRRPRDKEAAIAGEYDDETCIDLPDISRDCSTKSVGSDQGHGGSSRGHSVEQLPAHAV